jgi:hypothetical protein
MEQQRRDVDLLINGKLFPTWLMANFKKYKLEEIFVGKEDPCEKKIVQGFRKYQLFVGKFLDYRSNFKDMLIYHGLGSGKTATAINVYNVLYNSSPGWNIILLIKASLHQNWLDELNRWLYKEDFEYRMKNIIFVHYDSPFANKSFMEAIRTSDSSKKNMYIIDECHNFIGNVYSNISTSKGKRAQEIYDYIIQDKKEHDSTRVILLSGTPAVKNPFELSLLFNLLRPNIFPKSESQFNQYFINQSTGEISNAYKNMFQRRILGLVSYYIGSTPDSYATQTTYYVDVKMSEHQRSIYKYYEEVEAKALQLSKGKSESYRTYTRQACNFVFPNISQYVTGEQRPRPSRFRISDREAEKLAEGKMGTIDALKKESLTNVQGYLEAINNYINSFDEYLSKRNENDVRKGYTLLNDFQIYQNEYKNNYDNFFEKHKNKSELYQAMYSSSPKILRLIFTAMTSRGSAMIYSNYVIMEGLQLIKLYLKYFGFTAFGSEVGKDKYRYVEYSGSIDKAVREEHRKIFNQPDNKYGDKIRFFLLSPAAAEGLTLKNVLQVHILEPYWHEVRITQTIGRAIRMCSHADLPMKERHVDIYRYKSVSSGIQTADEYVEMRAKNRDRLISSFLDTLKEASVDCQLNHAHNSLKQDIKCFNFEEQSLLKQQIGPAYKKDILDDIHMNDGSNAPKTSTMKIRVIKIQAIKKLDDNKYTKPENYWYYPSSNVVYDYEMHYPIGKVLVEKDVPVKMNNMYVIDKVIPIPIMK